MTEPVRNLNSQRPFRRSAKEYFQKGWIPIALKPRLKEPENKGSTGRKNPAPSNRKAIFEFVKAEGKSSPEAANVGVRLSHEVIGIDIDDYDKKKGWTKYEELAKKYGELPPTVISTARPESKRSGIRFFRIPKKHVGKLSWSGKAADDIDIIQHDHRYAVVAPSYNPDAKAEYRWYTADWEPTDIPTVADLPELPEKWVEYLTRGYIDKTERPIDMDSTVGQVEKWYESRTDQTEMCRQMQSRLKTALGRLEEAAAHYPLLDSHFSIIKAGAEGHRGSLEAAAELEAAWLDRIKAEDGKRHGLSTARNEIFRSRIGAMRISKAEIEEMEEAGASNSKSRCTCVDLSLFDATEETPTSSTIAPADRGGSEDGDGDERKTPEDFDRTDDGNAEYLTYLYGENLKWIYDMKRFILWNNKRWTLDTEKHLQARQAYHLVRDLQKKYAKSLLRHVEEAAGLVDSARADGLNDGSVGSAQDEYKEAKARYKEWERHAANSGMLPNVMRALESYGSVDFANSINSDLLDGTENLLGVANGVIELGKDTVILRPMKHDDYITLNTDMEYAEGGWEELKKRGGDSWMGVKLWQRYLDTFLPDPELRAFTQKVMGYSLWGANPERLMVFLYGTTSTGKTVMLDSVRVAMGTYWDTFPLSIFKENDEKNPILLNLRKARMITTSEIGAAQAMDEHIVKRLVGDDQVSARYLNSNETHRFRLKALPVIATNTPPNIPHADAGLARRICVIPFNHQVDDKSNDKKDEMLKYAGPAILSWLVDGYLMYRKEGLARDSWPEAVTSATGSFTDDLSEFGAFFKLHLIRVDYDSTDEETRQSTSLSLDQVYNRYKKWAEDTNEEKVMGKRIFSKKMSGMGYELEQGKYFDGKNTKRYRGIAFVESNGSFVNFKSGTK
ncbi:DNA primase/polymerase [Gordonia phage Erutan]|uniref:DNA primase/polymerase n=1 Tax=Gordonia phage Erutan TaxID=3043913 RepID=A0AA96H0S4_9CAUD|nr:DNA primase/polymerase [Gordonia phage Erutan]